MPIWILTGPIRSGKTTALLHFVKNQENTAGFLTPDHNGQRQLFDLATRQWRPFEVAHNDPAPGEIVTIGKFRFYRKTFELAHRILRKAIQHPYQWLIVDELGKLELQGLGFEPVLSEVIQAYQDGRPGNLLLVIRDSLLEAALSHYKIQEYNFFNAPSEKK